MHVGRTVLVVAIAVCLSGLDLGSATGEEVAAGLRINTVSNRADLVSGGDVLVEIALPRGTEPALLTVTQNGVDISSSFAVRSTGLIQGLVTGLRDGPNLLAASAPGVRGAELVVTNHPIGGPIFSGEQVQPWFCTTERNGLGPAVDEQCNAAPVQAWRYRTTDGGFADYDPDDPPTDVATTVTDRGVEVPYVFVVETGAINRGIYRIAMLADPAVPLEPWNRPRGWNGGLYYKFGPSCGTSYGQADPIENVEDNRPLSVGYAVATSSLSVLGNNCNTVTSAESVMMIKERVTELFGPITHTRGKGGSGGSIGQHVVASGYPGLLQGLNVDLTFEDFWTTLKEVADCHLLLNYFTQTSPHLWPDVRAQGLVMGHLAISSCATWEVSFAPLLDPTTGCGVGENYHPTDNPSGCRATVQDLQVHVLGRRPKQLWTAAEQAAGDGFAEMPYDNVGQLYGLAALRSGDITPEQFVDLNEKVGGLDIDSNFTASRSVANPVVVETLYRSGMVASGETLSQVPMIDVRGFAGNAEIHTNFHSFAMRARLVNAQGHHENQSIWRLFEVPNLPSIAGPESFAEMGAWLRAIDDDTGPGTRQEKVLRNRPDSARDSCIIQDQRSTDLSGCAAFTYHGNPLTASGGPTSNDVIKCSLRPLPQEWPADGSFGPIPFTPTLGPAAGQWDRLLAAFPDGICDFAVPGVGQVPVEPWTTFVDGPGGVPLGPPPVSMPVGGMTAPTATPATEDLPATGGALTLAALGALLAGRLTRKR